MNDDNLLKHKKYNSQRSFKINLPFLFEDHELEMLRKHGAWYNALHTGKIKPLPNRNEQIYFTQTNLTDNPPINNHQKVWKKYLSVQDRWGEIDMIVKRSSSEDLEILAKILDCSKNKILKSLVEKSKNIIDKVIEDEHYSYRKVLIKVAHQLEIPFDGQSSFLKKLKENEWIDLEHGIIGTTVQSVSNLILTSADHFNAKEKAYQGVSDSELERKITVKIFQDHINKLSDKERLEFEKKVVEISKENGLTNLKVGSAIGVLTAANLSGFGVYILATSTLSTLSGLIGLTLPFAAYTGLTSLISTLTGPVGWTATGLYALYKFNDVNYKRIIPSIVYIHWLRQKPKRNNQ